MMRNELRKLSTSSVITVVISSKIQLHL